MVLPAFSLTSLTGQGQKLVTKSCKFGVNFGCESLEEKTRSRHDICPLRFAGMGLD